MFVALNQNRNYNTRAATHLLDTTKILTVTTVKILSDGKLLIVASTYVEQSKPSTF